MELKGIELKDGMIIESKLCKYVIFKNQILSEVGLAIPLDYFLTDFRYEVIKITYGEKILYEKKEILDEKEKEYLSAVIKPFRDKVMFIGKYCCIEKEFVNIIMHDDVTSLPCFKKGTMYKGMQVENKYTLEELGL